MRDLFKDIPESLTNLSSLLIKIEDYDLERDVVLPNYNVPDKFIVENDLIKSKQSINYAFVMYYISINIKGVWLDKKRAP